MIEDKLITDLLPVFVPMIVKMALSSSMAAALQRELTAEEIAEIMDELDQTADQFIDRYREAMRARGLRVSAEELEAAGEQLKKTLAVNAWELIQKTIIELKKYVACIDDPDDELLS